MFQRSRAYKCDATLEEQRLLPLLQLLLPLPALPVAAVDIAAAADAAA